MANPRKIMIKNGDQFFPYYIYKCECCGSDLPESYPFEAIEGNVYCGDCAFKHGIISEDVYLEKYLYFIKIDGLRASCKNGEIQITFGKFSWEKTGNERNTKEYADWRKKVFERDNYTCQVCKKIGGRLNAHHIKEYAKFPELRYEIDNGVTLCEECHKAVHRKVV